MNRLHSELQRLFLLPAGEGVAGTLLDGGGRTRALVLQVTGADAWSALAAAWQGVQREFEWPAAAIAVDGVDACQLWWALAQPMAAGDAQHLGRALCQRFLPAVPAHRVRIYPDADAGAAAPPAHAPTVPPMEVGPERWAAFVAPDLAALFAEEPWLDHPPGQDAQAELLSALACIRADALARAQAQLAAQAAAEAHARARAEARAEAAAQRQAASSPALPSATRSEGWVAAGPGDANDPAGFLLAVMRDPQVALALRIEAAKALLPHFKPA